MTTTPRVFCISSGKGGVGKTVIAANLGVGFSLAGFKVLLVDADITLSNLALHFQLEQHDPDFKKALQNPQLLEEAIVQYDLLDNLYILPSNVKLLRGLRPKKEDFMGVCSLALEIVRPDVMILDCPAGIDNIYSLLALMFAEEIIYVVTRDLQALTDARRVRRLVDDALGEKKHTGVIVNMANTGDEIITPDVIEKALETEIIASIPFDDRLPESTTYGVPFVLKYPKSPASREILNCVARLTGVKVDLRFTRTRNVLKRLFSRKDKI